MKNEVFERNYESTEKDELASEIFTRAYAPGGFMETYKKKMDAIPKVIVPEDKANYEYLLERCDAFARRHEARMQGVVDYEHWDAHIDIYLGLAEFDDPEDMSFLKDIGEKAHYCFITLEEDGTYRLHIMINYFQEIMSDEYNGYLQYETLLEDESLADMLDVPMIPPEYESVIQLMGEILDRFDNETKVDRTTAFKAVLRQIREREDEDIDIYGMAAMLSALLEKVLEEEKVTQ
jgi:hypothetical protein